METGGPKEISLKCATRDYAVRCSVMEYIDKFVYVETSNHESFHGILRYVEIPSLVIYCIYIFLVYFYLYFQYTIFLCSSFDAKNQFVLTESTRRFVCGDKYSDTPMGCTIIKSFNIFGEAVSISNTTFIFACLLCTVFWKIWYTMYVFSSIIES